MDRGWKLLCEEVRLVLSENMSRKYCISGFPNDGPRFGLWLDFGTCCYCSEIGQKNIWMQVNYMH